MRPNFWHSSDSTANAANRGHSQRDGEMEFAVPGDTNIEGSGILALHSQLTFDCSERRVLTVGRLGTSLLRFLGDVRFGETSLLEADILPVPLGRVLPWLWLFIGFVCSVDTYLSAKFPIFLHALEMNPVGRLLLRVDGGDPALLIAAKFFTGMLVMSVLILSHRWYSKMCWVLSISLTLFQVWLLGFLLLA